MDEKRKRENQRHEKAQQQLKKDAIHGALKEFLVVKFCMKARSATIMEEFIDNLIEL